jgi:hemerythrin-like domain-containing protein
MGRVEEWPVKNAIAKTMSQLRTDHRNMVLLLDLLDSEMTRLADDGAADLELVGDIMTYMTEYPDAVHHPKEDLLYGYIRSVHDEIDESLRHIESDHKSLEAAALRIRGEVDVISQGGDGDSAGLVRSSTQYSNDLRQHMYREEVQFFQLGDAMRDDGTWAAILREHDMGGDPIFGKKVSRRFRKLFNRIQRRLVWDAQQYFT